MRADELTDEELFDALKSSDFLERLRLIVPDLVEDSSSRDRLIDGYRDLHAALFNLVERTAARERDEWRERELRWRLSCGQPAHYLVAEEQRR